MMPTQEIVSLEGAADETVKVAELNAQAWWAKELDGNEAFAAMCAELGKRATALEHELVSSRRFHDPRWEDRARGQIAGLRFAEALVSTRLQKLAKAAEKERVALATR